MTMVALAAEPHTKRNVIEQHLLASSQISRVKNINNGTFIEEFVRMVFVHGNLLPNLLFNGRFIIMPSQ